jgi:thiol-disulfide isomerase/thioredoxin
MNPGKRLSLGCLALLMGAWCAAGADEAADALIRKARQSAAKARTLQADMVWSRPERGNQQVTAYATLRLMKPNYGRIEYRGVPGGDISFIAISDGTSAFLVEPPVGQFQKMPALPKGVRGLVGTRELQAPVAAFFAPEGIDFGTASRSVGKKKVEDRTYWVVESTPKAGSGGAVRYFFGPSGLLEGVEAKINEKEKSGAASLWLKNVRLNAPTTADQFAYTPPADFKERTDSSSSLLAVGARAPDFRLPLPGGGEVSLASSRQGKKAVLINFWFYGCGPCREELPHLQKIYDSLKDKGLELIAVNAFDSEDVIQKYVNENRFSFRIVMGGPGEKYTLGKAYGVSAYPTNYVVDGNGVIVWRAVGFDEEGLRMALAKLGLK